MDDLVELDQPADILAIRARREKYGPYADAFMAEVDEMFASTLKNSWRMNLAAISAKYAALNASLD